MTDFCHYQIDNDRSTFYSPFFHVSTVATQYVRYCTVEWVTPDRGAECWPSRMQGPTPHWGERNCRKKPAYQFKLK